MKICPQPFVFLLFLFLVYLFLRILISLGFWNYLLWADEWKSWPQMSRDIVTENLYYFSMFFYLFFFLNLNLQLSFFSRYLDYSTFGLVHKACINIISRFWQTLLCFLSCTLKWRELQYMEFLYCLNRDS